MVECIDSLEDAAVHPPFHANSDYWQLELGKSNQNKPAFSSVSGL